ncbi:MAG: hypothetical protein NC313_05285 [Butyrivibrio sp.]|nr:hypothetical protein [Butyrivibrio sp.]
MSLKIKSFIYRIIAIMKKKEVLAIQHNVDSRNMLSGKVAVILGGGGHW